MDTWTFNPSQLTLAQCGDSRAFEELFAPVKGYAKALARKFFAPGWDVEDLYQEALAGFAAALLSFDQQIGSEFHDYARLCMRNSVVTCVRRATRAKRRGSAPPAGLEVLETAPSDRFRPDLLVEQQAECAWLLASLHEVLSPAEWRALNAAVSGTPLAEVAAEVGVNQRAVENALSRARAKARRLLKTAA
jgi:RNA polymerase sporulation-specific sigma factor